MQLFTESGRTVATQGIDPVALITLGVAGVVGPAVADIVGVYVAIAACAFVGATWALGRGPTLPLWGVVKLLARLVLTSIVLTVAAENALTATGVIEKGGNWAFVWISFVIAGVGDDWVKIVAWAAQRIPGGER